MRLLPRSRVLSLTRHDSEAGKYLMRFSRSSSDSRFDRLHKRTTQPHALWVTAVCAALLRLVVRPLGGTLVPKY